MPAISSECVESNFENTGQFFLLKDRKIFFFNFSESCSKYSSGRVEICFENNSFCLKF